MKTIQRIPMMTAMRFLRERRGFKDLARWIGRAWVFLGLPLAASAGIVFQADFNGPAGTTGQPDSMVTLGGTAALLNTTNMMASISNQSPLFTGAPGYLHIVRTGTGGSNAGATIYQAPAANSLDSWFVLQTGTMAFNQINGGLDFFFRDSAGSSGWTGTGVDFRPLDVSGGNSGLRIILNAPTTNRLQAEMSMKNSAGTIVQDLRACNYSVSIEPNALYHLAVTASTNPSTGILTLKLFLAKGNTPIDTSSTADLVASSTSTAPIVSTGTNAIDHAFGATAGFAFGHRATATATVFNTTDFGRFRVYNSVPEVFDAVTYLPDLPNVAKPNPEPALPAAFDPFSPAVIAGGTAAANTPAGAEWTRTANPGDGLVIAGDLLSSYTTADEGKDTAYLCYGQNVSSLQTAVASIERQVGDNAAIRLHEDLPASAMYFIWPRNSYGYGAPMVVNQTEAWWIGPDRATRGETTSLYGRNLSYSLSGTAASNAWIYIKPQGTASGQWVTPTAVNPYKVDFTVPASLTSGTYEVWGHNGHGGHYGWSGPVLLTVNDGVIWTSTQFNVKDTAYGAKGDGVTDDTNAIKKALTASGSSAYSTVYFPPGTYMISSGLQSPANVRWLGAGAASSIIKFTATAPTSSKIINVPPATPNILVTGLGLDAGASVGTYLINSYIAGDHRSVTSFKVIDCILTGTNNKNQGLLYFYPADHITLKNVTFNGCGICIVDAFQCFIDSCTFNGMWDAPLLNIKGSSSQMSYTNNLGQDYDYAMGYAYDPVTSSYAGDTTGAGWSIGVYFKGLDNAGARHNTYFGNNEGRNLGVRIGNPNGDNWGEQISFENNFGVYYGTPLAATGTSVIFDPATMSGSNSTVSGTLSLASPLIATIIKGTGVGQWRDVGALDTTTGVVSLASGQSWNVPPDSSSIVALGWYCANVVSYQNHFDGKPDRVGPNGVWGTTGFLPYGGVFNAVADSNLYTFCMNGISNVSMVPRDATAKYAQPNYFHLYLNNVMRDCQQNIRQALSTNPTYTVPIEMVSNLGSVFRGNTASNTVAGSTKYGIYLLSGPTNIGGTMQFTLFEKNTMTDTPAGVLFANPATYSMATQGNILLQHNEMSLGSAASGSSYGISTIAGTKVGFGGNSYSNFATTYAGTPPGALMEVPVRVFEPSASRAKGVSATETVTVWNGGSSALGWNASSNQTWLTVSPASGTVADENSESAFVVSCAPGSLSDGTYVGTVTLTSGSQTKKIEVHFRVNP